MSEQGVTEHGATEHGVAAAAAKPEAARLSRGRRIAVWTLVVLATVIALVSVLTTWVHRQALDNHNWRVASAQVIQDKEVRAALATKLVNEIYANVDVSAELEQRLPKDFKQLSGTAAAALRQPATAGVEYLLAQPRFQQLFVNASDVAHQKLVNVLEDKTGYGISTGNGVVTLDVMELLRQVSAELGLPGDVVDKLPPDAGQITLMRSDQLGIAQKGVKAIKVLSVWLLVLVLALYAAAMYLAAGERRKTLIRIGWGLVIVGLLVLVTRHFLGNYLVDTLVSNEPNRDPVRRVFLIETAILGQIGWATILYGLLAVLGAMLVGPTPLAVGFRREVAPVLNRRPGLAWGTVGVVYVVLVLWGPTHALRQWWGILLLGGLLAAGVEALRRQTLVEFPAAGTPAAAPTLAGRAVTAARVAAADRAAARKPTAPAASSTADELARLAELRDRGVLSPDEFEAAKKLALS